MRKRIITALAILLTALPLIAQDEAEKEKANTFGIDVQLRSRAEYRNGVISPRYQGVSPSFFINERARLGLSYSRKNLDVKVAVQHVGVWGQDPQIDFTGRVIMNEAWAQLKTNDGRFFAKIGRQQLAYDGDRILGTLDWNVAGRWHDALKLGYDDGKHTVHLIVALNQNSERKIGGCFYEQSTAMLYKTMQTAWYHYKDAKNPFNMSLMFLNLGFETGTAEKAETSFLQTFGTKIDYGKPALNFSLEAYYQCGKKVKNVSSSAFMFAVNGNWKPSSVVGLSLGLDYLSGSKPGSEKNNAFDPLYGTHHKYYGFMDYFYAQPWGQWGLINPHLTADFKLHKRSSLQATYHYFATAQKPVPSNDYDPGYLSRGLGSEVDLQFTYSIFKDVTLQAGYSVMFGTNTMDALKGGDHKAWQDWGWIQININPRIFTGKW